MSALRPELRTIPHDPSTPQGATAYLVVLNAMRDYDGLIHGRLDSADGAHCAVGCYFAQGSRKLPADVIDQIATVNDSMPKATRKQRWQVVERWLRWKLTTLGMPGFHTKSAR